MTLKRHLPRIGLVALIAWAVTWAALNRDRFDPGRSMPGCQAGASGRPCSTWGFM